MCKFSQDNSKFYNTILMLSHRGRLGYISLPWILLLRWSWSIEIRWFIFYISDNISRRSLHRTLIECKLQICNLLTEAWYSILTFLHHIFMFYQHLHVWNHSRHQMAIFELQGKNFVLEQLNLLIQKPLIYTRIMRHDVTLRIVIT